MYDFSVDNTTDQTISKFLSINKVEDHIQKVKLVSLELFTSSFGKACKVTVSKGGLEVNGFMFNELVEGKKFPDGKPDTVESQTTRMKAVIAQLGACTVGDTFKITPTAQSFEELIDGLKIALKGHFNTTEFFVRLSLNKDFFAGINVAGGRLFAETADKLEPSDKSLGFLRDKLNAKPDNNPTAAESTPDAGDDNSDDLPF